MANIIGSYVTQPKIARIIFIVSGVLWWQYATYAFPCIMPKASSEYQMQCAHCVCHIFEGVWLLALPKADWDKVCPGSLRVCPWTVFSFIHLGCCPMTCQQWDEVYLTSTSALLLHLFQSIDESHSGTCFAALRKNDFARYPLLSVAFIFMMSLILFRLFWEALPCFKWSDAFLSCC